MRGAYMMQKVFLLASLLISVALPSQAINVKHMKNRIENATQKPEQVFAQLAETMACKGDKKPVCYTDAVSMSPRYALARVHRPEGEDLYLVYELQNKAWKLKAAGKFAELKPALLTVKMEISQVTAKGLIQNLTVLR